MRPILCLADDLTGGASLAAGAGELGGSGMIGFLPGSTGILDLGMRDLSPGRIRERVAGALAEALPGEDEIVSLRIDSGGLSLVGDYLEAALDVLSPQTRAFVMPVHPGAGRGFAEGVLRVGEARRPLEIGVRGDAPAVVPLADVRSPDLAERVPLAPLVLFEGMTPRDVRSVAAVVHGVPGPVVVADPGPLTLALCRLGLPVVRLLAIVGSTSDLTREQLRAAQELLGLDVVELNVDLALDHAGGWRQVAETAAGRLRTQPLVGVVTSAPNAGGAGTREGDEVSRLLGDVAAAVVEAGVVDALYLSGGHVAKAVCMALGATGLTGLREMDVLTSYGRLKGGVAAGMPVALKGGGIGGRATMARLMEKLDWYAASGAGDPGPVKP